MVVCPHLPVCKRIILNTTFPSTMALVEGEGAGGVGWWRVSWMGPYIPGWGKGSEEEGSGTLPLCGQIDRKSQNITFPHTRYVVGKYII